MKNFKIPANFLIIASLATFDASAVDSYSPKVNQTYPMEVYWGDTHLHTNLSVDAYFGGNKLGPEEAYRFAKGEEITPNRGKPERLRRPLDFLVIADHVANMGVMTGFEENNPELVNSTIGRYWYSKFKAVSEIEKNDPTKAAQLSRELMLDGDEFRDIGVSKFRQSVWERMTALADRYNEPGKFTALIGYEWTPASNFNHRVVIFKDDAKKTNQVSPFSAADSTKPKDLWAHMEMYEKKTGGEVLAIPHGGNLTRGVMFALEEAAGGRISKHYAQTRSRWEPLFEVTQTKGDSETHTVLSPTDEFADFETVYSYYLPKNPSSEYSEWRKIKSLEGDKDWMRQYEYARSGLKLGLDQQAKLGVNPFKFGMIGSTDFHDSLSRAGANVFLSELISTDLTADFENENSNLMPVLPFTLFGSGGYAAVWAAENTREALFAGMKRKEAYATTGTRITVRFFGGWEYLADEAFWPDLSKIGYSKGVPMGGDLTRAPKGKSPRFLIRAVKDPDGANLDRVQVIKGWRDEKGELHEKIYNVALSDGRKETRDGKVPPVGSTVDIQNTTYTNSIGDPELATMWQDPNFNKDELAFYYVRVLEIPTPRKVAHWAVDSVNNRRFSLSGLREAPLVIQERAYTSPIWYSPE